MTDDNHESLDAGDGTRELEMLQIKTDAARAELARIERRLEEAQAQWKDSPAGRLVEVNERLVAVALRAQSDAEATMFALDEVSQRASCDPLTGLPNRTLLLDRLALAIAGANRRGAQLALLFLDLNDFKQVNDTLGHSAGDWALNWVASQLTLAVREADTVSRHGGDEFLILLPDVAHAADAALVADKIIAAIGQPVRVGDQVLRLTVSIGIALFPAEADDAGALVAKADAAMYCAKRYGLGSCAVHVGEAVDQANKGKPRFEGRAAPITRIRQVELEHEERYRQLRDANERLVVAALDADQLRAAAVQAHRRQVNSLAVVAHELRGPLAPIRNAAALLGKAGNSPSMLAELRAMIERQVTHMARLVGDLLDVSRAATGQLRLERADTDLVRVIKESVDACRPGLDARQQQLTLVFSQDNFLVSADAVRLRQAFMNLLDNASKYTPELGTIRLGVDPGCSSVAISVEDSGIGIAAEALSRVFEPFERDAHAIGFDSSGLGIGLAVVRQIIEAHGGGVVASSAGVGLGSRFVVTLPTVAPERSF